MKTNHKPEDQIIESEDLNEDTTDDILDTSDVEDLDEIFDDLDGDDEDEITLDDIEISDDEESEPFNIAKAFADGDMDAVKGAIHKQVVKAVKASI